MGHDDLIGYRRAYWMRIVEDRGSTSSLGHPFKLHLSCICRHVLLLAMTRHFIQVPGLQYSALQLRLSCSSRESGVVFAPLDWGSVRALLRSSFSELQRPHLDMACQELHRLLQLESKSQSHASLFHTLYWRIVTCGFVN